MTIFRTIHGLISLKEITLELSDFVVSNAVKNHNVSYTFKKLATWLLVYKTWIEYNGNSLEEMKKRRNYWYWVCWAKAGPEIMKVILTLDYQAHKIKTRRLCFGYFVENYKSNLISKICQTSSWMIVVSNIIKRKIKKIFL